jgi:predicted Zn-dependent peptidase
VELTDSFAKLPQLVYAWHTPAFFHEGDAEFDILAHALGATGTGRLYRVLVHERQLAQSVSVYQGSRAFSSIFEISVIAKSGVDLKSIEAIVDAELGKVRSEELTKREVDRAVVSSEASGGWRLEGLMARAETLQLYNHYVGTPDYLSQDIDRMRKSSPAKVLQFASTYLGSDKRVVMITRPEGSK